MLLPLAHLTVDLKKKNMTMYFIPDKLESHKKYLAQEQWK